MILDKNFMEFAEELSSAAPVPGGGSACAAVAALAAALGEMVAHLTAGKKKYAQYEEDVQRVLAKAPALRQELMELADEDVKAFEPLSRAYGLPKETEEEKAYKEKVMAETLRGASLVPLRMMEKVSEAVALLEEMAVKGSRLAISDVGVGAAFAGAALKGASLNVFINTRMMKDRKQAEEFNEKANRLLEDGTCRTDAVFASVREQLSQ